MKKAGRPKKLESEKYKSLGISFSPLCREKLEHWEDSKLTSKSLIINALVRNATDEDIDRLFERSE
jgi:hypothetical protein